MSDNKVSISKQRNFNDIAIELTELYVKKFNTKLLTKEELSEIYKFFYETAMYSFREL